MEVRELVDLKKQLQQWDGKSTEQLEAVYLSFSQEDGFLDFLIKLLNEDSVQVATTWLIKHYLQQGGKVSQQQSSRILDHCNADCHWQSQLHFLQLLSYLIIANRDRKKVEAFIRHSLTSDNKFVRAWAYNGFDVLATQFSQYRHEADEFMQMALQDEAASVKARIRNILKNRK